MENFGQKIKRLFNDINWYLKGIKVFALVGKSGTGKSFRAKLVAEKYGIHFIIDDGLLINDDRIIAGKSAKKESQYIHAIRTALFDEPSHRSEVIHAMRDNKVRRILILGTSEKMVDKVTRRLGLPSVNKIIKIEEIATQEDIANALESRTVHGMHIIPVPTIEIKRDYAQILADSIKILFRKGLGFRKSSTQVFEKSVVRPKEISLFPNRPSVR